MNTTIYQDPSILNILETRFHNDKEKFVEAIKEMFQTKNKLETQEYNLLKSYDRGELSIGQIGTILNLSKYEVMELLENYDIPFIRVDKEYIEHEFNAFK
jgi:exonuclease VII small subunit